MSGEAKKKSPDNPALHIMHPRRVGFLLQNLGLGGAERQALELAKELPRHGWEAVFLLVEGEGEFLEEAHGTGIRIHALNARYSAPRWHPGYWLNLFSLVRRIHRVCDREGICVLQAFLVGQDLPCVLAGMTSGRVGATVVSRLSEASFNFRSAFQRKAASVLSRLADVVVCNSRGVRRDATQREGISRSKTVVIHNGIDAERFAKVEPVDLSGTVLHGKSPLIGIVGTLRSVKRHDLFLQMFAKTLAKFPDAGGLVVGADGGCRDGIDSLAREPALDGTLHFTGGVSDPRRYYAAMDVLVLCSDSEGFPNVILEGMASGLPVVTTRVPGAEDAVLHGKTGFVVPPGNVEMLTRAVCSLLQNDALRRTMGAAGRRRVDKFSIAESARRYSRLYRRLTGDSSGT